VYTPIPIGEAGAFAFAKNYPSFRTEQADFFFRFRSCESVGLRREKSLRARGPTASTISKPCAIRIFRTVHLSTALQSLQGDTKGFMVWKDTLPSLIVAIEMEVVNRK
jgi:hypothetical protein